MALRFVAGLLLLVIGCAWAMKRPVVGVCLAMFLFIMNPFIYGAGLEEVRFQFIATLVLLLSWVIHRRELPISGRGQLAPLWWLSLFVGWNLLASSWAAQSSWLALSKTLDMAKILLFAFIMSSVVVSEGDLKTVVWTLLISLGLKAFDGRWSPLGSSMSASFTVGFAGSALALYFPLLALNVLGHFRWKQWTITAMIAMFMLDFMVFRSQRSAFVGFAVGSGLLPILSPNKRVRGQALIMCAAGLIAFTIFIANEKFWNRMTTISDPESEASAHSRFIMNEVSMRIIADHPWGIGFANFEHVSGPYISAENVNGPSVGRQVLSAHNTFLNVLAETGYVGFALWITALVTTGVRLWRISCRHSGQYFGTVARALFIGLLAIVPAMLTHNEEQSDYLYWVVGLACAIYGMEFRTSVMPVPKDSPVAAREIPSKEAGRA
jgi:hypothetical protein